MKKAILSLKNQKSTLDIDFHLGLNILGHAQMECYALGSQCGGHGSCGRDRIQIKSKDKHHFTPPTQNEKERISPKDLEEGWRLACQTYLSQEPNERLEIFCPILEPTL